MGSDKAGTRRRYDADTKARVIAECEAPGNSVARVAMAHGINSNVVHRWRQASRMTSAEVQVPKQVTAFVPVAVADDSSASLAADIRVELRRGPTAMTIVCKRSVNHVLATRRMAT